MAVAASTSFTLGLFLATAVFPVGPLFTEVKMGALLTVAGALAGPLPPGCLESGDCDGRNPWSRSLARRDGDRFEVRSIVGRQANFYRGSRPCRGWLLIIVLAKMVETATSLAGPLPLKIVIDQAIGPRTAPAWLFRSLGPTLVANGPALDTAAALSLVLLAVLGGLASYIDDTHRLNTIRGADTTIVLHNGIVAEQGTHDDLIALGGV
jgi:hypothetical protein